MHARDMIATPAGTIAMRDDRTGRAWTVAIGPLHVARHSVTQAQWRATMKASPSRILGDRYPVETVSWLDAIVFCNRASHANGLTARYAVEGETVNLADGDGYRLPSEAEWEHACRAGTTGPRYGAIDAIAWYAGNAGGTPHEVGLKQPNAWGLHDMLGNVWEWCWDLYDPAVYGSYRIFRGGGWADDERGVLATNRRRSHPSFAIDDLGLRLVRDR